jgi:hypothetical protein
MLRKTTLALVAVALGGGASVAVAACGEDRGEVQVETSATGKSGTETSGTETSGKTETSETETGKTETSP